MEVLHSDDSKNSKAKDVYIRASYTKIFKVDTQNQRFEAEAIIESKWYDPDITSEKYDISNLKWKPELYIDNAINDPREQVSYKILFEDKKYLVSEVKKLKGIFSENLELANFPLDIQDLTLQITSKNSTNKVNFILTQNKFSQQNISNTLDKSMWHLHNAIRVRENSILREYSYGKRVYPCIEITCQVFRHSGYFHWNALLPILLITICSLAPFVLDSKATASRLGTTASMLLSSVSYKIAVSRLLPTVSYLTSLDMYCIGSLVVIAGMLAYHALFGLISGSFDQYILSYFDRLFAMGFTTIIILKQLVYVKWLIKIDDFRSELILKSKFREHDDETNNDINKKEN